MFGDTSSAHFFELVCAIQIDSSINFECVAVANYRMQIILPV